MENTDPNKIKKVTSWVLYDFANTIFSMNVVTIYFPLLITSTLGKQDIWVSMANSISMVLVALTIPVLGVFSDRTGRRTPYLLFLTVINVIFTALIGLTVFKVIAIPLKLLISIGCFIVANWAFQGALPFYNALLPKVIHPARYGRISGLGVSMGYLGAIVGLVLVMPFNEGTLLGWNVPFISGGGREATFLPTAFFFALFSIPTFLFLWEKRTPSEHEKITVKDAYSRIWETLKDTKKYPCIRKFLISKFFYEDGIQTAIIFMAVYAEKVMGFPDSVKIPFFIVATIGAAIGSYLGGLLVDRWGSKKVLEYVLFGWVISLVILIVISNKLVFWGLGCIIGALMGCVWTAARPLLIRISPPEALGRFFGLYAFSGKVAAISGPLIWGIIVKYLTPYGDIVRYKSAVLALGLMILIGAIILKTIKINATNNKDFIHFNSNTDLME
ncbi:MFS transporter [bacterium]|nr:MFS transporter [bacterium]